VNRPGNLILQGRRGKNNKIEASSKTGSIWVRKYTEASINTQWLKRELKGNN
jgi:hypothetical protein